MDFPFPISAGLTFNSMQARKKDAHKYDQIKFPYATVLQTQDVKGNI